MSKIHRKGGWHPASRSVLTEIRNSLRGYANQRAEYGCRADVRNNLHVDREILIELRPMAVQGPKAWSEDEQLAVYGRVQATSCVSRMQIVGAQ